MKGQATLTEIVFLFFIRETFTHFAKIENLN
jgi:hypothetical protein